MSVWYSTNDSRKVRKPSNFYEFRLQASKVFNSLDKDLLLSYDDTIEKFRIDKNETDFSENEIIHKMGMLGNLIVSHN